MPNTTPEQGAWYDKPLLVVGSGVVGAVAGAATGLMVETVSDNTLFRDVPTQQTVLECDAAFQQHGTEPITKAQAEPCIKVNLIGGRAVAYVATQTGLKEDRPDFKSEETYTILGNEPTSGVTFDELIGDRAATYSSRETSERKTSLKFGAAAGAVALGTIQTVRLLRGRRNGERGEGLWARFRKKENKFAEFSSSGKSDKEAIAH